jgi:hypothetical protein
MRKFLTGSGAGGKQKRAGTDFFGKRGLKFLAVPPMEGGAEAFYFGLLWRRGQTNLAATAGTIHAWRRRH